MSERVLVMGGCGRVSTSVHVSGTNQGLRRPRGSRPPTKHGAGVSVGGWVCGWGAGGRGAYVCQYCAATLLYVSRQLNPEAGRV